MSGERAIVVGAGVAGLAAARRLAQHGYDVTVLESAPTVGGRLSTREQDGYRIDLAASMMLGSYRRTAQVVRELGCEVEAGSDVTGIALDGRVHALRGSHPADALRTKLLSGRAKARMPVLVGDVLRYRRGLEWGEEAAAADLDIGSARDYADSRLRNPELRDRLLDPACRFLCLSSLQDVPAVDFLALGRNMGKTSFFNSATGMQFLSDALAATVHVETDARVSDVEEAGGEVRVSWERPGQPSRTDTAQVCVIATPAPVALDIHPQLNRERREIYGAVNYAPSINVFLGLDRPPPEPAALILVGANSGTDLCAVILDHNKASGRVPDGAGLVSTYWHRDWSKAHWQDSDEDVVAAAWPGLRRVIAGVDGQVRTVHVQRWRDALVSGPLRRHRDIARFRALTPAGSRIRFAGDAISSSNVEACLRSGERAAEELRVTG